MPRIPYVTDDEAGTTPLVDAIRRRRGGTLLNLDRQPLHSPPFAEGWNALLGAVRTRTSVDALLRELAICVVAVLNDADYEFIQHAPEFIKAGGVKAQVDAVRTMKSKPIDHALFDEPGLATIALAFQMTTQVAVDDATFATLLAHLGRVQMIELVGVVATYNMVSRFLVALGIEAESP
jgi:alkylhydroperoxidase family enzyme